MNLYNSGKTLKSQDDVLIQNELNFRKQEDEVRTLDEAFGDYVNAMEIVKNAEAKLMTTWSQNIHDWQNLDSFLMNADAIRSRRNANVETLKNEVIVPMMTYRSQFREVKSRIDKCEAKRIEFNRSAFLMQQLEIKQSDATDGALEVARAKFKSSQDAYNTLVAELNWELPQLYQARRQFFATNLQSLFTLQQSFHTDVSYHFRDMSDYVLVKLKFGD